jgi:EAL and modified HD-GYP domain-containing signal transduction protein
MSHHPQSLGLPNPSFLPPKDKDKDKDSEVRFIARQPILDCKQNIYGYELLFRAGATATFCDADGEAATRSTLDLSLLLGAGSFTEGRPAFINCTREALCSGIVNTLPKEHVVLEVLENVPADEETVRECQRLKRAGYRIALDDVVSTTERLALFELADIVKVDFRLTDTAQQAAIAKRFRRRNIRMLAEKVETHEQFHDAIKMGYTLFQGYFFCRPETMEAKDLPSVSAGYMEILRKVYEPELDYLALERAIREEPSLCYRLLRYLNSAAFGNYPVYSIVHALNLLGSNELRKWVSLVAAISLAGPRSAELIHMALVRARFCELLAESLGLPTTDYFLTGLFSLLDAILDRPLTQIIELIPISTPCRDALTGAPNQLRLVLDLAIASAQGEWDELPPLCEKLGCMEMQVCQWQIAAQSWVRAMLAKKAGMARIAQ